jgi:DNA-binding LytR/AlgR family response regulator
MSLAGRRAEPLRALLVDDEEPALAELRFRLEELGQPLELEIARTSVEALRLLYQRRFDVLFLDIQMPGLNGLELAATLEGLPAPPAVVFVTAYDEYAVSAFELRAVDYLLKPVAPSRLRETLGRLRQRLQPDPPPGPAEPRQDRLERLPLEAAGRTVLVDLSEIRFAEARDDVTYVKTADQLRPTRFTLQELERRLPSPPFLRIHRAFLVNLRNVVEIRPYFNGAYLLKTNDREGSELTVSRGHVKDLRSLLGL